MIELLPCPFCDGEASIGDSKRNGVSTYWVYCEKCRARSDNWFFAEKAAEMWNRRFRQVRKKEAAWIPSGHEEETWWYVGTCSCCGMEVYPQAYCPYCGSRLVVPDDITGGET